MKTQRARLYEEDNKAKANAYQAKLLESKSQNKILTEEQKRKEAEIHNLEDQLKLIEQELKSAKPDEKAKLKAKFDKIKIQIGLNKKQ